MNTNTVQDLLNTVKPEHSGITCPACGSIISIRKQGTYNMILTKNARLELDGAITNYRSFLEGVEGVLAHINIHGVNPLHAKYPYKQEQFDRPTMKEGGIHQGTPGAESVEQYMTHIDYFEWVKIFYSVTRQSEIRKLLEDPESNKDAIQKIYNTLKEKLIVGLEPRSLSGPLVNLIFEQKFVANWMKKYNTQPEQINRLLEEVCPTLQWYLNKLLELDLILNDSNQDSKLVEGIRRVQFILAILLGHKTQANPGTVADLGIKPKVCFTLPRITFVSPKQFCQLLCSEVVLSNPKLGWEPNFVKAMRQQSNGLDNSNFLDDSQSRNNSFSFETDRLVQELGPQVTKFVHFACNGPSSAISTISKQQKDTEIGNDQKQASNKCGWYPKPEKTHSVIFLGSPGTGKSTVMLTGFTAFYNYVQSMGATISFDSPRDEAQMKQLNEQYWAGQMPSTTKEGWRQSIKLTLEFPEKSYKTANFVFTDIPGEVAARSLTEEGSDPAVLRILKNAETVIFFFDLSIEPCIREKLTNGDEDNIWKDMQENYLQLTKSRQNRAEVSQLQLLQKLLQDLRSQKGDSLPETNFICVIPKADLFVNEDSNGEFFMTPFYEFLQAQDLLVSSRQHQDDSFSGLQSILGTGSQLNQNNKIEDHQKIAKQISQKSMECLAKIGDSLGNESAIMPQKVNLNQLLKVRLIQNLFGEFGKDNVYFLPVSAQGENGNVSESSDTQDDGSVKLNHPPNQKLSEYVFALPVCLCAERTSKDNDRPSQTPQREVNWESSMR